MKVLQYDHVNVSNKTSLIDQKEKLIYLMANAHSRSPDIFKIYTFLYFYFSQK